MITKESVCEWLNTYRHSRDWLAEQCGVHRRTVDNWLVSPRPIPAKAIPIIQRLMAEDEQRDRLAAVIPSSLVLHFTRENFRLIQEAARAADQLTDEWAEAQLLELAEADVNRVAAEIRNSKSSPSLAVDNPEGGMDTNVPGSPTTRETAERGKKPKEA